MVEPLHYYRFHKLGLRQQKQQQRQQKCQRTTAASSRETSKYQQTRVTSLTHRKSRGFRPEGARAGKPWCPCRWPPGPRAGSRPVADGRAITAPVREIGAAGTAASFVTAVRYYTEQCKHGWAHCLYVRSLQSTVYSLIVWHRRCRRKQAVTSSSKTSLVRVRFAAQHQKSSELGF